MKVKFLAVLVAAVLCCGGCGQSQPQAPIDYAAGGFEASVAGVMGEVSFEARIIAAAPDPAGSPRDVSIEFFAPESLAGVKMARRQGVVSLECGGISFEAAGAAWLEAADLLCAGGRVTGVNKVPDSTLVSVDLIRGDYVSTLTVDAESGQPVSATLTAPRDVELRVTGFLGG